MKHKKAIILELAEGTINKDTQYDKKILIYFSSTVNLAIDMI